MKKLAMLCSAVLGAALLVLGTAPGASAYPELTCQVSVDRQVIAPGDTFTVTGQAQGVDSKNHALPSSAFSWTFEWNGVTKYRTGALVTASFQAPQVTRAKTITLTARNSSPAGDCVRHVNVEVRPALVAAPSSGNTSGMPNTGGPKLWLLVAGLVLVLGGGGAVAASRKRS